MRNHRKPSLPLALDSQQSVQGQSKQCSLASSSTSRMCKIQWLWMRVVLIGESQRCRKFMFCLFNSCLINCYQTHMEKIDVLFLFSVIILLKVIHLRRWPLWGAKNAGKMSPTSASISIVVWFTTASSLFSHKTQPPQQSPSGLGLVHYIFIILHFWNIASSAGFVNIWKNKNWHEDTQIESTPDHH